MFALGDIVFVNDRKCTVLTSGRNLTLVCANPQTKDISVYEKVREGHKSFPFWVENNRIKLDRG